MPISVVDVTPEEVKTVLATEEGHFADVKAIEIAPARLTKTLAAFANADGGEIYIGIDEDRRRRRRSWRGFESIETGNGHLQAFEQTFPLDGFVEYQFLRDLAAPEAGLVLKAAILKTPDIRKATDGAVYIRRGAQNLPVTAAEALRRLEYAKGVRTSERDRTRANAEPCHPCHGFGCRFM